MYTKSCDLRPFRKICNCGQKYNAIKLGMGLIKLDHVAGMPYICPGLSSKRSHMALVVVAKSILLGLNLKFCTCTKEVHTGEREAKN